MTALGIFFAGVVVGVFGLSIVAAFLAGRLADERAPLNPTGDQ